MEWLPFFGPMATKTRDRVRGALSLELGDASRLATLEMAPEVRQMKEKMDKMEKDMGRLIDFFGLGMFLRFQLYWTISP